jgi:outer membrane protein OmpA-like peptidoglycan-associated protein
MKILTVGLLLFIGWSVLTSYLYVCQIMGFCAEIEYVVPVKGIQVPFVNIADKPEPLQNVTEPFNDTLIIKFGFDKSDITPGDDYSAFFEKSRTYMFKNQDSRLNITGHTDAVGSDDYNSSLGLRRAQKVKSYFEGRGVPAEMIIVDSRGENDPVSDNGNASGREKNRRAVVNIIKQKI